MQRFSQYWIYAEKFHLERRTGTLFLHLINVPLACPIAKNTSNGAKPLPS